MSASYGSRGLRRTPRFSAFPALFAFASLPALSLLGALLLGAGAADAKPRASVPKAASAAAPEVDRVDLNSAGVDELCTLPGIGPKKAEAIIAFRERRPFTRVTQLLGVKGIGARTLERLRPFIYVRPPGRAGPAEVSRGPG